MLCKVEIDLTGSRLGVAFRSVECIVEWPGADHLLREMAAAHYEVPLSQVRYPSVLLREDED